MDNRLQSNDHSWPLDIDGHLADAELWSEAFAEAMAAHLGLTLSDDHWWLLRWVRQYWLDYHNPPLMRSVVSAYRAHRNDPSLGSSALYGLLSEHPVRQACQLAGVPKPDWCI
ncbi:MAG: TusE/DsrC/DsvC family sulfur relay protein [Wenzhouxiangella sp.]|jgi:tRNA 2-thiouridine synthesizing protein E|nr:TusE/DsrC/DsvC family sulfur relay protein [Wenzhouxiangella sp.]